MSNIDFKPELCKKNLHPRQIGRCLLCQKEYRAAYKIRNVEFLKASDKLYRTTNSDRIKAANASYRAANKGTTKIYAAAYRAKNAALLSEKDKEYRAKNVDVMRAKGAAYYKINAARKAEKYDPKEQSARNAAYYVANRDALRAKNNAWSKANRGSARTRKQNRRAREKNAGGKLSPNISATLLKRQRGRCTSCFAMAGSNYHLDHIMPLALGGANEDKNMQILCASCNCSKGQKHPVEFMQSRGFLL